MAVVPALTLTLVLDSAVTKGISTFLSPTFQWPFHYNQNSISGLFKQKWLAYFPTHCSLPILVAFLKVEYSQGSLFLSFGFRLCDHHIGLLCSLQRKVLVVLLSAFTTLVLNLGLLVI